MLASPFLCSIWLDLSGCSAERQKQQQKVEGTLGPRTTHNHINLFHIRKKMWETQTSHAPVTSLSCYHSSFKIEAIGPKHTSTSSAQQGSVVEISAKKQLDMKNQKWEHTTPTPHPCRLLKTPGSTIGTKTRRTRSVPRQRRRRHLTIKHRKTNTLNLFLNLPLKRSTRGSPPHPLTL